MDAELTPIGPGVTQDDLDGAERRAGLLFPESLRLFLAQNNGAYVSPEWFIVEWSAEGELPELAQIAHFYDLETIVKESCAFRERLPEGSIPIGQDPGGSQIIMQASGKKAGALFFWHLAYDSYGDGDNTRGVGFIAGSLEQLLASMEPEPEFE